MPVFSRYNPRGSGKHGVVLQAHPNAEPLPWIPLRTTTRTDSQWGGQGRVHRVQPHERGITFQKTELGSWVNGAAPSMGTSVGMAGGDAGGCGCGGGNKGVNKKA